jgi:predicted acyl esterase
MVAMFSKRWRTSERQYGIIAEHDVRVPLSDGVELHADIFRPNSGDRFPAIVGFHPYDPVAQWAPIAAGAFSAVGRLRPGQERGNGYLEAGDPAFFVRRGYVHVLANVRGTGKSGGTYPFLAPPEPQDGYELVEWVARQPWCTGQVGMFGVSYFARIQLFIAALNPPHLKCVFAPWASTDQYRDAFYHGGILNKNWALHWGRTSLYRCRYASECRREWGEEAFEAAIARALQDPDLSAVPELVAALRNPTESANALLTDIVLNPLDGPFWEKRRLRYDTIEVPAYIGADWSMYGLHLPGAFRSWEQLRGPKKMIIGPPAYLDRPVYQLHYEALRWFDYWLKGCETEIMDEPPIRLFVMGTHQWRSADEWPLAETRWTPFYLHENGLLWEREHYPNEGATSFADSPWMRGAIEFTSPRLVEETEVIGPAVLVLYASTTDSEVLWFVSLREVDASGHERVLTRGWLRGSHRAVDPARSAPWQPYHPHTRVEPLTPGTVYEFQIPLVPTANLFRAGARIKLRIACTDDEPAHSLEAIASGHIRRQAPARITVYHDDRYPSHLLLPITRGNVLGTYISGGEPYL